MTREGGMLRPELIPTHDPKLSEVKYGVASRSNFGGAHASCARDESGREKVRLD